MWTRAVAVWCGILVLAVINGMFREGFLKLWMSETAALAVSSLLLATLVLAAGRLTMPWIGPTAVAQALAIGVVWVGLTLAFEFLAGHYLFGNSWDRLLADYDVLHGRIWVVVLVATFVAPVWAFLATQRTGA